MTDRNDPFNKVKDMGYAGAGVAGSLAVKAATLAPIAGGVYYGLNKIISNRDYSLKGLNTGPIGEVNTTVGQNISKLQEVKEAFNAKKAEQLKQKLMETGKIKTILSESSESRKALIGAVLEIIDDPGAGTKDINQENIRDRIVKLLETEGSGAIEEEEKIIKSVLDTVLDSGSASTRSRFEQSYDRLRNFGIVLQAPQSHNINGLNPKFSTVNIDDAPTAIRNRVQRIQNIIGQDPSASLRIVKGQITGLQNDVFEAHVMLNNREKVRIRLNEAKMGDIGVVRSAKGTTSMGVKKHYITAKDLLSLREEAIDIASRPNSSLTSNEAFDRLISGRIQSKNKIKAGSFFDFQANLLERLVSDKTMRGFSAKDFYAGLGEVTDQISRSMRIEELDPTYSEFSKGYSSVRANQMVIYDVDALSPNQRKSLVPSLVSEFSEVLDPAGIDPIRRTELGSSYTTVSLKSSGTLSHLKGFGGFGMNRTIQPVTAREQQFIGRKTMFVDSNQAINKIASTLNMGATTTSRDLAFAYADDSVARLGRTHRAAILNVNNNALSVLGLGEGEAYMGGIRNVRVREDLTKTTLDLAEMKKSAPALYNELIEARRAGVNITVGEGSSYTMRTGDKRTINTVEEFFSVFGVKGKGAAFGLSEGESLIPRYQGLKRLNLRLAESTLIEDKGRTLMHLAGTYDVESPFAKVFGYLFKGTVKDLTDTAYNNLGKIDMGGRNIQGILGSLNLGQAEALVTEGAMLKKSPVYLALQMIGGGALASGQDVNKFFSKVTAGMNMPDIASLKEANIPAAVQRSFKQQIAENVARELASSGKALDTNIGMVFGGIFSQEKDITTDIISRHFGARSAGILKTAEAGYVLGLADLIAGPQISALRDNLGSMEPRTYKFLQNRLQNVMGLSVNETSDIMTSFISRLGGVGENLKTLQSLEQMATSMVHGASVTDVRYRNLNTVSLEEFMSRSADIGSFLSEEKFTQGKGFMLDLTSSDSAVRAMGGKKQIFIAGGKELIENMPNILISGSEGKQILENEYVRRVGQFSSDLAELQAASLTQESKEVAKAQKIVGSFIEDYSKIFGSAFRELLRGRMTGSTMAQGGAVVLQSTSNLGEKIVGSMEYTDAQKELINSITTKTKSPLARSGGFALVDTEQFLAAMKSYIGGETDSIIASGSNINPLKAKGEATINAGEMFQRFFLGMEGDKRLGITGIVTRHPQLSSSHVAGLEIFRNVSDVGSNDQYFKRFTETKAGASALADIQKYTKNKITGFGDIAAIAEGSNKNLRSSVRRFFTTMSKNISSFSMGEGGGRILFPSMMTDVHYSGGVVRRFDISMASGMIGDFDGDTYQLLFPSKAARRNLSNLSKEALAGDVSGRLMNRIFVEETSKGIRSYANKLSNSLGINIAEGLFEEPMKEIYVKNIGELDISLDKLRMGMVGKTYSKEGAVAAHQSLGLLAALEEIGLKSKKAARAIPIADEVTSAVESFIKSKGSSAEGLERVLTKIFSDTEFMKGGSIRKGELTIGKIQVEGASNDLNKILASMEGQKIKMSDIFDQLKDAAIVSHSIGASAQKNVSTMAQAVTRAENRASYHAAINIGSPQGAMMTGAQMASEDVVESGLAQVRKHLSAARMMADVADAASSASMSRALAPIGLGMAASIAVGSLIGDNGYAPTPLIAPGEFSDARVSASIMAGTATDRNIEPDSLPQGVSSIDMNGRPINSGVLNITRPNSFAMRGEVTNYASINDTMNIMSSFGASGSIIINDQRRPMSRHFMDRMMGE